jgi:hypothetical protein
MSVEISRTSKYGDVTKYQSVHLSNGNTAKVPILLDAGSRTSGRTVWLRGGNVRVEYDGQQWIEMRR